MIFIEKVFILFIFILFCKAQEYQLKSNLIVENDKFAWNHFRSLQIIDKKEIVNSFGTQIKPVLMYEVLNANGTNLNYSTTIRFQVVIPDSIGNRIVDILTEEEPSWMENNGSRILAIAKSLQDKIFAICKAQSGKESLDYYVPIEISTLKVDLMQLAVNSIASINWTDPQREPQYNITGKLIGWTEASNLTSTVHSDPFFSAIELGRDNSGSLFILIHSDHSTKLLSYNLFNLTFRTKALINPYVVGAPPLDRTVGKLYVDAISGISYVIVNIDSYHRASFENLHHVSLNFPKNQESTDVLLVYNNQGINLFISNIAMEQCESTYSNTMYVSGNRVAITGNCILSQGFNFPFLQILEFGEVGNEFVLQRKTSFTIPVDSVIVNTLKWLTDDTLVIAGNFRETDETAFLGIIDAENGDILYSEKWGEDSYNTIGELEVMLGKGPSQFYFIAQRYTNEELHLKSKAAVFQLNISNPNITTPWFVLGAIIGFNIGFMVLFVLGQLVWQKRKSIDEKFLLASHPKTKKYMEKIFNSFKKRKKPSQRPLLEET